MCSSRQKPHKCWRSSRWIEQRICTPYVAGLSPAVSSTNRAFVFSLGWLLCIAGAGLWLDHLPRPITHVAVALARFIAGTWGKMPGGDAGMINLRKDGSIPSKRRGSTATGPARFDSCFLTGWVGTIPAGRLPVALTLRPVRYLRQRLAGVWPTIRANRPRKCYQAWGLSQLFDGW